MKLNISISKTAKIMTFSSLSLETSLRLNTMKEYGIELSKFRGLGYYESNIIRGPATSPCKKECAKYRLYSLCNTLIKLNFKRYIKQLILT